MLEDPTEPQAEEEFTAICAYSKDVYPISLMVQYGDHWIAVQHKDAFIQSLREVAPLESSMDYKAIIIWWEKSRILFNLIIGGVGLLASFSLIGELGLLPYVFLAGLYAIAANLCFLAGPMVDLYLHILFIKGEGTSLFRFIALALGVCFSVVITIGLALATKLSAAFILLP